MCRSSPFRGRCTTDMFCDSVQTSIHGRSRRSRAFTLMEVVITVTVIGFCAGLVIAAFSSAIRGGPLAPAANVLASDVEFCQQECIARPSEPRKIVFNVQQNQYSIYQKG